MGLLAEARAKTEVKNSGSVDSNQSVGLLAEARARKNAAKKALPIEIEAQPEQAPVVESPQRVQGGGRSVKGQKLATEKQNEREAFLSSLPVERRALLESISPAEAGFIALGKGFSDVGRGVGIMDQPDQTEQQAFKELETLNPTATTIGEVAGQAAPFVPLGMGAGLIASTPLRVAATTALGATEGATISRGQGRDIGEQIFSAGVGGSAAGALELGLPIIGRLGGKIVRRVLGKAPDGAVIDAAGKPSQELIKALKKEGVEFSDLVDDAVKEMKVGAIDPEQAARKAFLESQGLTGEAAPTRAQITRAVDDFSIQQEALKSSGRVEKRIAAQDRVLSTRFNDAIEATGGDVNLPTSSIADSLVQKANVLDDEISTLYKRARSNTSGEKVVRFTELSKKLKELAPLNQRAGGNISAVFDTLKQKGLIDKKFKPTGRLGVEETETQVRQLINQLYDTSKSGGDPVNSVLRELKSSLDDDVFKAAGDDLFLSARKAKHRFESDLTRAKVSKFDSRTKNLVRDVLENKDSVAPDRFTDNVVFGKSWRDTDLAQLKDYISTEGHGKAAWNDLRADVLQKIKEKSFIGPEDANGFQSLSRDKIEKAIDSIGMNKMKVLFSPEEIGFLTNLKKVAQMREPRKMTQKGFGPSAKAIMALEKKLKDMPIIGAVFGFIDIDSAGRMAVRSKAQNIATKTIGSQIRTPLALGAGGLAVSASGEEN